MNQPLLSIIIPTKDRYFYLKHLLSYLLKLDSNSIEIVIQDNTFDNQEFSEYLKEVDYPMLKYAHVKDQIPISLNSDLAILNSTGKYVCFIGDDDGVTSLILPCVKYMEQHDIDVVVPDSVVYKWPDAYNVIKAAGLTSSLKFKSFRGDILKVNAYDKLMELLNKGCSDRRGLPLLYHGIVRRSTLDIIYKKGGTYFPGSSPDIANGVALCLTNCTFFQVNMPIIIAGSSKFRGGGARQMKNHAAKIEEVPFLPPKAKENWESKVPKIWTGKSVWCESSIKAMRYMGREDLVDLINFEALYASFIASYYPLRKFAYQLTSNRFKLFIVSSCMIIRRFINGGLRVLHINRFSDTVISNITDIESAINYLDSNYCYLSQNFKL